MLNKFTPLASLVLFAISSNYAYSADRPDVYEKLAEHDDLIGRHTEKLATLEKATKGLTEAAQNLQPVLNDYNQRITSNKEEIEKTKRAIKDVADASLESAKALKPVLDDHEERIKKNEEGVRDLAEVSVALKPVLDDHEQRITSNKDEIEKTKQAIKDVADASLESAKALKPILDDHEQRITNNKDEIGKHENRIADLERQNKPTREILDAAEGVNSQRTRIEALENYASAVSNYLENANADERITENEKDIDAITERTDTLESKVAANEEGVGKNKENIEALQNYAKEVSDYLEKTNADDRITANEKAIDAVTERTDTLESAVSANNDNIEALNTHAQQVSDYIEKSHHEERITQNETDIDALTNYAQVVSDYLEKTNADDRITANEKDIDAITERTDTLESAVNANSDNIDALNTHAQQVSDYIEKSHHEERIKQNETDIDNLQSDAKAVAEEIDDIYVVTDALEGKVASNVASINKNTQDIAAITTDIAMVSTNKANIEVNKGKIAANEAAVNTNRSLIAKNTARIDTLDRKVNSFGKEMRRGLASQAALSGLFQPYTVGKANITAAVGGYKSQTAIAVGAGYRVNQNVAVKAGVAMDTKGSAAAYNVGVNFEW